MDKASLRRHLRVRLYTLSDRELRLKSSTICDLVITTTNWQSLRRISCYQSQSSLREVDTSAILAYIKDNWPMIELEVIEPRKQASIPRVQYDLIIIPVLGFDDNYNRLGRGGGWYDRFLSNQDSAKKIGLAFDCQRVSSIPIEDFDVELDDIFTESY